MDSAGLNVCTNGYVGIETWTTASINAVETMVEEIIKAFVNSISLVHEDSVTFCGGVADGCYCINLKHKIDSDQYPFQSLKKNREEKGKILPPSAISYKIQIIPISKQHAFIAQIYERDGSAKNQNEKHLKSA